MNPLIFLAIAGFVAVLALFCWLAVRRPPRHIGGLLNSIPEDADTDELKDHMIYRSQDK